MKLADVKCGDQLPGDSGSPDDVPPPWLHKERFLQGQIFFQRHLVSLTLAMHCSLACGLAVPNLLDALVFTKQSDTPSKSLKRYLTTFYYLMLWHTGNVWDDPNDKAFKAIRTVRGMHKAVANSMNQKQSTISDSKHVSQYDMALVQCGFMGAITLYPRGFGIKCTTEELCDYIHFWRGIGYLLGISDQCNICSGNFAETYAVCNEIQTTVLLPSMRNPPEHFDKMIKAYCDGINMFTKVPFYSKASVFAFVYDIMALPMSRLNWADWLRFWFLKTFVFCIRWVPMFEKALNYIFMRGFTQAIHAQEKKIM